MKTLVIGLIALILAVPAAADVPSRLSAVVAFETHGALNEFWLDNPAFGYVEAHFRIPAHLADDVVFGVDQEWLDGVADPHFGVPGGDWMGFVGLQRTGTVWVAAGTDATMTGIPSTQRNWQFLQLGTEIIPDEWYKIRVLVNFAELSYAAVTIVGPNVDVTIDLSAYTLDYPNYAAFDGRAMTYYVWSLRSQGLADNPDQTARVFFDDVSAGYIYDDTEYPSIIDDFEETPIAMADLPFDFVLGEPARLSEVRDGTWYLERDEALVMSVDDKGTGFARSGRRFLVCDADLNNIEYGWWVYLWTLVWSWFFSLSA